MCICGRGPTPVYMCVYILHFYIMCVYVRPGAPPVCVYIYIYARSPENICFVVGAPGSPYEYIRSVIEQASSLHGSGCTSSPWREVTLMKILIFLVCIPFLRGKPCHREGGWFRKFSERKNRKPAHDLYLCTLSYRPRNYKPAQSSHIYILIIEEKFVSYGQQYIYIITGCQASDSIRVPPAICSVSELK